MKEVSYDECFDCDHFVVDDDYCRIFCKKNLNPDICNDEKSKRRYEEWNDANCID